MPPSSSPAAPARAAADCFAADGARVAVLARSQEQLDATEAELTALGSPDAVGISVDLFDGPSVEAAIAQVGERWGHLNALVNVAGPMEDGLKTFETYTDDDWHRVFDGLTLAAVRTASAALPLGVISPITPMGSFHTSRSVGPFRRDHRPRSSGSRRTGRSSRPARSVPHAAVHRAPGP